MLPVPPVAVILALIVRSSVARLPSAAIVMLPPTALITGTLTVTGLPLVIRMDPPLLTGLDGTPLITPLSEFTVPIVSRPPTLLSI